MNEWRMFLVLSGVLFFWFMFGLNYLTPWIESNYLVAFSCFILIETYLISRYVLFPNEKFNFSKYAALLFTLISTDILMFPYLVGTAGVTNGLSAGAMMSSDIFIWNILPNYIIPIAKYIIVYVIAPALLLMAARSLTTKRGFARMVGGAA